MRATQEPPKRRRGRPPGINLPVTAAPKRRGRPPGSKRLPLLWFRSDIDDVPHRSGLIRPAGFLLLLLSVQRPGPTRPRWFIIFVPLFRDSRAVDLSPFFGAVVP